MPNVHVSSAYGEQGEAELRYYGRLEVRECQRGVLDKKGGGIAAEYCNVDQINCINGCCIF